MAKIEAVALAGANLGAGGQPPTRATYAGIGVIATRAAAVALG
jgi:hypothetical protein